MKARSGSQDGFSYIDVMIAITILLVGVMTLGAALTGAVVTTGESEQRMRAKLVASSVLESVLASPTMNIAGEPYNFDSINYTTTVVGTTMPGKFVSGRQALYDRPGTDGLYGTADDSSSGGSVIQGMQFEIVITDQGTSDPILEKRIDVNVYYDVKGIERSDSLSTITTRY